MTKRKTINDRIKSALIFVCIICGITLPSGNAFCSEKDSSFSVPVKLNLRGGALLGPNNFSVMSICGSINVGLSDRFFVGFRAMYAGNNLGNTRIYPTGTHGDSFFDQGIIFGIRNNPGEKFDLRASCGLSYMRGRFEKGDFFEQASVPLEISAYRELGRFGFGVTVIYNCNSKMTYYGANVGIEYRLF